MRIGTGIVLLVVGAVLRFAITLPNPVVDLPTVGVILMIAGFVTLVIGVLMALRPNSTVETTIVERPEPHPPTRPYPRP